MILRDRYGWPVELIIGKPVTNIFRRILVTNWPTTWFMRRIGWPASETSERALSGPITSETGAKHD